MSIGNEINLQLLQLRGLAFRFAPDRTSECNDVYVIDYGNLGDRQ